MKNLKMRNRNKSKLEFFMIAMVIILCAIVIAVVEHNIPVTAYLIVMGIICIVMALTN